MGEIESLDRRVSAIEAMLAKERSDLHRMLASTLTRLRELGESTVSLEGYRMSPHEREHPGVFVRRHVLPRSGKSVNDVAAATSVNRQQVSRWLNGHVRTSIDIARGVSMALGIPARELLVMQAEFDAAGL